MIVSSTSTSSSTLPATAKKDSRGNLSSRTLSWGDEQGGKLTTFSNWRDLDAVIGPSEKLKDEDDGRGSIIQRKKNAAAASSKDEDDE